MADSGQQAPLMRDRNWPVSFAPVRCHSHTGRSGRSWFRHYGRVVLLSSAVCLGAAPGSACQFPLGDTRVRGHIVAVNPIMTSAESVSICRVAIRIDEVRERRRSSPRAAGDEIWVEAVCRTQPSSPSTTPCGDLGSFSAEAFRVGRHFVGGIYEPRPDEGSAVRINSTDWTWTSPVSATSR